MQPILLLRHRARRDAGFTLLDLLFVVGLIGLLASMAIPGLMKARGAAQASSALGSLRVVNSGELSFAITCGLGFYAPDLPTLGIPPPGSTESFLSEEMTGAATFIKSGYNFSLAGTGMPGAPASCTAGCGAGFSCYAAVSDPLDPGSARFFGTNSDGVIYQHTATLSATCRKPGPPAGTPIRRALSQQAHNSDAYVLRSIVSRPPEALDAQGTPRSLILALALLLSFSASTATQGITTPKQQFGFNIGDDYQLATYDQFVEYWQKLDKESDRMKVVDIGKTAEGRPQLMAIITSPDNFKKLDRFKDISRKLATVDGLNDDQARALAKEGKGVVWFDGGLHATEVLGAHQLMETVYQLVSRNDAETVRFLNDLVILAVHANPDGMQLVSNWYMREKDPARRSTSGLPRLYEKYAGHDNNRDFYMSNLPESINMNKVLYTEWFPQIMYNHHQTGPAGTVMFAPPFRDPFNFNFDPLVPIGIDIVGAAMANRMAAEGKPGLTTRKGSNYSTWWNGGLRTTVYFHNMIGLLTETIGNPTPVSIPFLPSKQLPDSSSTIRSSRKRPGTSVVD